MTLNITGFFGLLQQIEKQKAPTRPMAQMHLNSQPNVRIFKY